MTFEEIEQEAKRGDAQAQYQYAFALANLPQAERNPALVAKWLRLSERNGCESARQLIGSCGADPDDGRLYAEVRILLLKDLERLRQEELEKEADDIEADEFIQSAGYSFSMSIVKMLMTISKIRAVIVGII